ncbi:MAG: hypothetical protein EOM23_10700 [Candidatus Moranbacteria bacterium]|nr:hypothetical protein [Candidatus Moranbacteria bacterium]
MKYFKIFSLVAWAVLSCNSLKAFTPPDEGMWLPMFVERLNYVDMQKMGLKLTAEELYSINNSSLKDAIVNFGNFCTAELVSPEGLLFTNHHCGYGAIQAHSSIDHDYLTNGFWAYSKDQELENKDLTATFLVRMEDVSNTVLADVTSEMTESQRNQAVRKVISKLEKAVVFASLGIRIFPGTHIHRKAIDEGFVTEDRSLLSPVFYFSPDITPEFMNDAILKSFDSRMDRVYPWEKKSMRIIKAFHDQGYRGPVWDFLLRNWENKK